MGPHAIVGLYTAFALFWGRFLETKSVPHPRLEFTLEDSRSIDLPHRLINEHIQLLEDAKDRVIIAADQQLYSLGFNARTRITTIYGERCEGPGPPPEKCNYNITVLIKKESTDKVFMCESSTTETACCFRKLSPSAECLAPSLSSEAMISMAQAYHLKTGESAFLDESRGSVSSLFVTQSSVGNSIGIYKFGPEHVRPTGQNNVERHYLGLVASRGSTGVQDKLYAFFKEKNNAGGWETDAWLPFIAQVCMADSGGTKNKLQYEWTSQLKARLFCGDRASQQHYPELVDVAFHRRGGRSPVSRVYALFHNQWRMSAVCVYSMEDIQKLFNTSAFKRNSEEAPSPRPGTCTAIPVVDMRVLSFMQGHPEMESRVAPAGGTLLVSRHPYTHLTLHAVERPDPHTLLYLSLESGRIHKVLESRTGAFIIAEYRAFAGRPHILGMVLQAHERKLYVSTRDKVVQLDMGGCGRYGDICQDCVMARDPYCGWDGTNCVDATRTTLQDVETGNYLICPDESRHQDERLNLVLDCPISSRHATYSWHFPSPPYTKPCRLEEGRCTLGVPDYNAAQNGFYSCRVQERGSNRTLTWPRPQSWAGARALTLSAGPLAWVCAVALVFGGTGLV